MERTDFVHCIAPLFYCTASDSVSGDTRYKQLREWNIILATSLTEVVMEHYRVQLDAGDFIRTETINDLYQCVKSKQ
ncbi:MAG: hypothetical protein IJY36_07350 [Coprobacter sp.]|nr:hypothetical protein [Coprobacter sp.]